MTTDRSNRIHPKRPRPATSTPSVLRTSAVWFVFPILAMLVGSLPAAADEAYEIVSIDGGTATLATDGPCVPGRIVTVFEPIAGEGRRGVPLRILRAAGHGSCIVVPAYATHGVDVLTPGDVATTHARAAPADRVVIRIAGDDHRSAVVRSALADVPGVELATDEDAPVECTIGARPGAPVGAGRSEGANATLSLRIACNDGDATLDGIAPEDLYDVVRQIVSPMSAVHFLRTLNNRFTPGATRSKLFVMNVSDTFTTRGCVPLGDPLVLGFQLPMDAYAAILETDPSGLVRVLYPNDDSDVDYRFTRRKTHDSASDRLFALETQAPAGELKFVLLASMVPRSIAEWLPDGLLPWVVDLDGDDIEPSRIGPGHLGSARTESGDATTLMPESWDVARLTVPTCDPDAPNEDAAPASSEGTR